MQRLPRAYQQGVLASVPAAVAASLLAILAGWPSPLEPLAELLMEWTPLPLADLLLLSVPTLARPAGLLGALALAMLICGLAGALGALFGARPPARAAGLVLGAALILAVLGSVLNPVQAAAEGAFAVCWLAIMTFLSGRQSVEGRAGGLVSRSAVILSGAVALLTLSGLGPLVRALGPRRLFSFRPPRGLAVPGLTPLVTSAGGFYRMDKVLQPPVVGPPGWRLTLFGAVERPLILDYSSLLRLTSRHRYVTMECIDNPVGGRLISNALWTGVPLAELLMEAGAREDGLVFHSADGDVESVNRRAAEASGALVAYAMNGETLPREHGYPARLLLPGHYGFKSVKWLTGIEVVARSEGGVWQRHGWSDEAIIRTTTRIDVARRTGDGITVAGIAFAGTRGIRVVQVRVNGGPWRNATLGARLSAQSWAQWAIRFRGGGPAHIEARAVDGAGRVQSGEQTGSYPDGATGWASATV